MGDDFEEKQQIMLFRGQTYMKLNCEFLGRCCLSQRNRVL